MKKLFIKFFLYSNILLIIFTLLSYLSEIVSPEDSLFLPFMGLMYPYFLFFHFLFILFWILRKKYWWILSSLTILLGWQQLGSFVQFNIARTPEKNERTFKLVSYNVRLFDLYNWSKSKNIRDKIFTFIEKEKPDILCIQEFYSSKNASSSILDLIKKVTGLKYYHLVTASKKTKGNYIGIITLSRFPIINKGEIRYKKTFNLSIYSDIQIGNDTFRIYNNHLESLHFGHANYNFIDSIAKVDEDERVGGAKKIYWKFLKSFKKRALQADILSQDISNSPYPVIVAGDFNDTPISYSVHKVKGELNDAFKTAGLGIGQTYLSWISPYRIDFIFYNAPIIANDFYVSRVALSDHYPVSCSFSVPK